MKKNKFLTNLALAKQLCETVTDPIIQDSFKKNSQKCIFEIASNYYKTYHNNLDPLLTSLAMQLFPWATHDTKYLSYQTRKSYYYTTYYILNAAEKARIEGKKGITESDVYTIIKKYRSAENVLKVILDHQALFLEDGLYKRSQVEDYNFKSIANFYNLNITSRPKKFKDSYLDVFTIKQYIIDLDKPDENTINYVRIEHVKSLRPGYTVLICGDQTSLESKYYNPNFVGVITAPNVITLYSHIHNYSGYKRSLGDKICFLCNDNNLGLTEEKLAELVKLNTGQEL